MEIFLGYYVKSQNLLTLRVNNSIYFDCIESFLCNQLLAPLVKIKVFPHILMQLLMISNALIIPSFGHDLQIVTCLYIILHSDDLSDSLSILFITHDLSDLFLHGCPFAVGHPIRMLPCHIGISYPLVETPTSLGDTIHTYSPVLELLQVQQLVANN